MTFTKTAEESNNRYYEVSQSITASSNEAFCWDAKSKIAECGNSGKYMLSTGITSLCIYNVGSVVRCCVALSLRDGEIYSRISKLVLFEGKNISDYDVLKQIADVHGMECSIK